MRIVAEIGLLVLDGEAGVTLREKLIKTMLRLERTVCRSDRATKLYKQTSEIVFWVSSDAGAFERVDPRALAHRQRQP
jgi:hypothetical protein